MDINKESVKMMLEETCGDNHEVTVTELYNTGIEIGFNVVVSNNKPMSFSMHTGTWLMRISLIANLTR